MLSLEELAVLRGMVRDGAEAVEIVAALMFGRQAMRPFRSTGQAAAAWRIVRADVAGALQAMTEETP